MNGVSHSSKPPPPKLVHLVIEAQSGTGEALEAHLRKHPEQRAAARQLAALWRDVGTIPAPGLRIGARTEQAHLKWAWPRLTKPVPIALAALVLLASGAFLFRHPTFLQGATGQSAANRYRADETSRRIALADGSVVTLASHSIVRVRLAPQTRLIALEKGEAYFEVAHDEGRPFIVASGGGHVRAVGTEFDVHRIGASSVVTVTHGVVRVFGENEEKALQLVRGQQVRYVKDHNEQRLQFGSTRIVNGDEETSWKKGFLTFTGMPLRDVLDRVNQHSRQTIKLSDPVLGEMPIFATLKVGETEGLLALIREQGRLSPAAFKRGVHVQTND
jgi:transmembrane sensor